MALTRITKGVIKPNENYQAGIVTATGLDVNGNGDISGDLNVGGILTYEDVTSIDAVGIITAQQGIHVGAGVSAVGVGTFSGLDISGDIDVDGHTNLDNVNIAGIATFASDIGIGRTIFHNGDTHTTMGFGNNNVRFHTSGEERFNINDSSNSFYNYTSVNYTNSSNNSPSFHVRNNTQSYHTIWESQNTNARSTIFQWNDYGNSSTAGNLIFRSRNSPYEEHARFTGAGNFNLLKDLDVDGHTNLDNVSIAGVTTFSVSPVVPNGGYYKGIINSGSQQKIVGGYISGTDTLRLGESMYLTSTGLGIGTDSPSALLHLHKASGDAIQKIESSNGAASLELRHTNGYGYINYRQDGAETFRVGQIAQFTSYSVYNPNSSLPYQFCVEGNGEVGINTHNPANTLHLLRNTNHGITLQKGGTNPGSASINVTSFGALDLTASNNFNITSGGSQQILFNRGGTTVAKFDTSSHLVPGADSSYDLGLTGTRWRNVYADTLYGDGSNLTGITQTTINNNANNRLITGSNTANTLDAESALTFYNSGSDPILTLSNSGHAQLTLTSTSGTDHCSINFGDSADHDAGEIRYTNSSDSLTFDTAGVPRMTISSTGILVTGNSTVPNSTDVGSIFMPSGADLGWLSSSGSITFNAYYSGGWKYVTTGTSHILWGDSGGFNFSTASSGSANGTISYSRAMKIHTNNRISIGDGNSTTPLAALHINTKSSMGTDTALWIGDNSANRYMAIYQNANSEQFSHMKLRYNDNGSRSMIQLSNPYAPAGFGSAILWQGYNDGQQAYIETKSEGANSANSSMYIYTSGNKGLRIRHSGTVQAQEALVSRNGIVQIQQVTSETRYSGSIASVDLLTGGTFSPKTNNPRFLIMIFCPVNTSDDSDAMNQNTNPYHTGRIEYRKSGGGWIECNNQGSTSNQGGTAGHIELAPNRTGNDTGDFHTGDRYRMEHKTATILVTNVGDCGDGGTVQFKLRGYSSNQGSFVQIGQPHGFGTDDDYTVQPWGFTVFELAPDSNSYTPY